MTLSGLAIAIGMLGDGAIVLVENAVRIFGDAETQRRWTAWSWSARPPPRSCGRSSSASP